MKAFVSAKFEEKNAARSMMYLLTKAGHTITHDWTGEDSSGYTGNVLRQYLKQCAQQDAQGVLESDVLVILYHEDGKGMFTEHGLALTKGIPVIVVGVMPSTDRDWEPPNIFFELPNHFYAVDQHVAASVVTQLEAQRREAQPPTNPPAEAASA